ncbi:hypothetical protein T492DRAFT_832502 [Pavlovales sp. CCMP2436]|nr:hypothetical protein T492DRAFT_832502 [Pavlovales sp. CCMP2436]
MRAQRLWLLSLLCLGANSAAAATLARARIAHARLASAVRASSPSDGEGEPERRAAAPTSAQASNLRLLRHATDALEGHPLLDPLRFWSKLGRMLRRQRSSKLSNAAADPKPNPWERVAIADRARWENLVVELNTIVQATDLSLQQSGAAVEALLKAGIAQGGIPNLTVDFADLVRTLPPAVADVLLEFAGEPRTPVEAQLAAALVQASEDPVRTVVNWAGDEVSA